ncbi:glycosyl hydrolase [Kitasatospora sp. NPDC057015]|uniref:glycosyl hydrolase n=1 Tax=Kitasatospora sp. NPDC057015 TaxID=3346001 RepID=UPI003629916A
MSRTRPTRPRAVLAAGVLLPLLLALAPAAPAAAGTSATGTPASGAAAVYEAEDGQLNGVQSASAEPGHSGTGYVEGFDAPDDTVTVTVPDSPGGLYDLTVRYRSPYGDKKTALRLNGAGAGEVSLASSTVFADAPAGRVLLRAGVNTVALQTDWGWYQIDAISLAPAPPPPPHRLSGTPVDPAATPEARSLLSYLGSGYGDRILSGQQDTASVQWLEQNIGRAPAVEGLDLMDYSPSRVEHGASSQEVENALAWDARGGITTFVWHWNAPSHLVDQPGKEWWRGFYTDASTFDLAAALADPGSDDYRLLIRDIDAISVQLSRLQDAGVPVLWRPLHEAEGGWFWWGAKGPGPAKELYRLMYDRMVNHNHLHNLVWVWNSVDAAWYPGDDVVDVVSTDSYPPAGDHGPVSGTYDRLVALGKDAKPVALGEVGTIPDPDLLRAYHADWSWFVTWSGGFLTDGTANSRDFLKRVYDDPYVVTLDELGDFKHSGGCRAEITTLTTWNAGAEYRVTVRNTGSTPTSGWQTGWNLPAGSVVTQSWNADVSAAGGRLRASALSWNGVLQPGRSAEFYLLTNAPPAFPVTTAPSCTTTG